jgi:hypothetical protein
VAKHNGSCDPEQPAENGHHEDDPDQSGVVRADNPAQFHLPGVGDRERDHDDERRDECDRRDIETSAMRMPAQS